VDLGFFLADLASLTVGSMVGEDDGSVLIDGTTDGRDEGGVIRVGKSDGYDRRERKRWKRVCEKTAGDKKTHMTYDMITFVDQK